jgi:transcriptional regulator with XRE-family HTH domain
MTDDEAKLRRVLSANIKHYRVKLGYTQEKLAETVGLSDQTINDIEGCRTWVSDKTIRVVRKLQFLNNFLIKIAFLQGFARKNARLVREPTGFPNKSIVKVARVLNIEAYQLFLPQTEAEKFFPVKVPADILQDLKESIKEDLERRFSEVITTMPSV